MSMFLLYKISMGRRLENAAYKQKRKRSKKEISKLNTSRGIFILNNSQMSSFIH